jgi:hypothetical protein
MTPGRGPKASKVVRRKLRSDYGNSREEVNFLRIEMEDLYPLFSRDMKPLGEPGRLSINTLLTFLKPL